MGGRFCHLTLVTPIQATPEPLPVRIEMEGQLRLSGKAGHAWAGFTAQLWPGGRAGWEPRSDYSLIMLGTLGENLPRNLPAPAVLPLETSGPEFPGPEHGAPGSLSPSQLSHTRNRGLAGEGGVNEGARWAEGLQRPKCPEGRRLNSGCGSPTPIPHIPLSSGVTFSDVVSATEPCKPCTECVGLQSMSAPCVEADDAVCRCAYGYYQDETTGRCEACRVCEAGSGLVFSCQDKQNTVCEECPDGTYSDEANHVDPCLPCTVCEDTERQLRECTRWADAECEGESPGLRGEEGAHPGRQGLQGSAHGLQGQPPWPRASRHPPDLSHQRTPSTVSLSGLSVWKASSQAALGSHALVICGCRLGTGWVAERWPLWPEHR